MENNVKTFYKCASPFNNKSSWLLGTVDSLMFAVLDTAFTDKDNADIWANFGKGVAIDTVASAFTIGTSAAASAATSALGNTASAMAQAMTKGAITAVGTYASTVATSYLGALDFRTGEMDWEAANKSWYSTSTIAGTLGAGVSAGLTAGLEHINTGSNVKFSNGMVGEKLQGFNPLNMKDIGNLNSMIGSLAGQGIEFAISGNMTLNILNLGMFTGGKVSGGLLELHLGRDGTSMNFGINGANVSLDNIMSAVRGAQVWNVNNKINDYNTANDYNINVAMRGLYSFGDSTQVDQLWDILKGGTDILFGEAGTYYAETLLNGGNREINLGGGYSNLSSEEQMRLAAILGHEAYRDGYGTGEFDELKGASIARILMGDRINQSYNWFYSMNGDFAFESYLLNVSAALGNYTLFDDYLSIVYKNEKDYFFQPVSTGGNYQNENPYRDIPLHNADTQERVDEINRERMVDAYNKFKSEMGITTSTLSGEIGLFELFKNDEGLQAEFGYKPLDFESIYMVGCMFMAAKYGVETLTGDTLKTSEFNDFLKKNSLYLNQSDLSYELMVTMNP